MRGTFAANGIVVAVAAAAAAAAAADAFTSKTKRPVFVRAHARRFVNFVVSCCAGSVSRGPPWRSSSALDSLMEYLLLSFDFILGCYFYFCFCFCFVLFIFVFFKKGKNTSDLVEVSVCLLLAF